MSNSLDQKVIVVTGAAGRLGSRIVSRFAEEGAKIAAIVRNEQQARAIPFPEHGEGWAFLADVVDEEMVEACFEQIGNQFGHVDALVHAVGCWEAQPLLNTSLEAWNQVMQCNLTSTFLCFREATRLMQDGPGTLIGFASGQGADSAPSQQGAYAASKAGLIRLVEAVASEFKEKDITAHAVAPSNILFDEEDGSQGVTVDDVADLCLYLCAQAGRALNGSTIRTYGNL